MFELLGWGDEGNCEFGSQRAVYMGQYPFGEHGMLLIRLWEISER